MLREAWWHIGTSYASESEGSNLKKNRKFIEFEMMLVFKIQNIHHIVCV